jgi:uncharacterized protein (TIGR02246 family)
MKEVLTKSFWHGVKKTYDEALAGPLPTKVPSAAPVEGDLDPAPRSETQSIDTQASDNPVDPIEEASQESFPASDSPAWAMGSEPNASIDEQEIRQLVSTWIAASKAGDVDTILSLMTDDVVFLLPGQPVMHKADFAAAARARNQDAPQLDASSEIQEIRILGDWAFMWTKLTVVLTPPGGAQPLKRAGHTLTILKKQSGKWVFARDANMLVPVPNVQKS